MVLQYARSKSDATVKLNGTEEELEAHKRRRVAEKGGLLGWCGVWVCQQEDDELVNWVLGVEEARSWRFIGSFPSYSIFCGELWRFLSILRFNHANFGISHSLQSENKPKNWRRKSL